VLLIGFWLRGRSAAWAHVKAYGWRSAIGGVIAAIGYGIAIWALSQGAMAHVAALRETSVLFAALMGVFLLHEAFGWRRVVAACFIVSGLILMNFRL
jgi:drug/metabolite transporter (DMT)-like permease